MENPNKYLFLWIFVIIAIIYIIFRDKINSYLRELLNANTNNNPQAFGSCQSSFFVKLPDGTTQSINTVDISTTATPIYKYQKKDVTFTEDGITNVGSPIDITKSEFDGFCKYKYTPPYNWYSEIGKGVVNSQEGRKFAQGGRISVFGFQPNSNTLNANVSKVISNKCATIDWYDTKKRHYHIEIYASDCSQKYVGEAKSLIEYAMNNGKLDQPEILDMEIQNILYVLQGELNSHYHGFPQFKMSINGISGTGSAPPIQPIVPTSQFPTWCNPKHIGFDMNGNPRKECGYNPKPSICDPNHTGYDINGYPNKNC